MKKVTLLIFVVGVILWVSGDKLDSSDALTDTISQIDDLKTTDRLPVFQYLITCLDDYLHKLNDSNKLAGNHTFTFSSNEFDCIVNIEYEMFNALKSLTKTVNVCVKEHIWIPFGEHAQFSIIDRSPDPYDDIKKMTDNAKQCNLHNSSSHDNLLICIRGFLNKTQPVLEKILTNTFINIPVFNWKCYVSYFITRYRLSRMLEDLKNCIEYFFMCKTKSS